MVTLMNKDRFRYVITPALLLLMLFFYSVPSLSETVKWVYRADSRSPDLIFSQGFLAMGGNINFSSHIRGRSTYLGTRDSAFIATTPDEDRANDLATMRAMVEERPYYVYRIRANYNIFNAVETLYHIWRTHGIDNPPDDVVGLAMMDYEYSAYQRIDREQIESVITVTRDHETNEPIFVGSSNPNFVDRNTHSSIQPFTLSDRFPISNDSVWLISGPPVMAAQFEPDLERTNHTVGCFSCIF